MRPFIYLIIIMFDYYIILVQALYNVLYNLKYQNLHLRIKIIRHFSDFHRALTF